jgi:16S rRNA (cytidine1402-2'-O)-methyltransferase
MLYIVSTPIGNLGDISYRASEILEIVDIIAAEDTRRTRILLDSLSIKTKSLISYNEHNEEKRMSQLIDAMKDGKKIALVSDSGTPCISDPGFKLVREAITNNIQIIPVPGASAILSAVVASGLPTDSFSFYGFISKKSGKKNELLRKIKEMDETAIIYESPYRIAKTLMLIEAIMPDKNICLCREITKKFEEFIRGKPSDVLEKIGRRTLKGEMVIVIGKEIKTRKETQAEREKVDNEWKYAAQELEKE